MTDSQDIGLDQSTTEQEELPTRYERFSMQPEKKKFKWDLPEGLLKFVKKYFNNYVPDKTIKESILIENPRPTNLYVFCQKCQSY